MWWPSIAMVEIGVRGKIEHQICQAGHNWKAGKRIVVISVILTGTLILALGISLYIWKKKWQPKREGNKKSLMLQHLTFVGVLA
ncbi:hypothetical protein LOK49_LG06G00604 [Camellia lanceoleosa]|uniref:Uncharacterized protein n=1 Tax=Camellia lanceoleosa TaxID=1840588 RepID=A0ACC0HDU9_9ERIC|nr:hypothetical protein LOK49_LG06G00604 [Camellia lanceoleosa]